MGEPLGAPVVPTGQPQQALDVLDAQRVTSLGRMFTRVRELKGLRC